MKSEEDRLDDQIAKVFDEVTVTRTGPDGKPVSEFAAACEEFREAHKKFERWDTHPEKYENKWIRMEWWACLNKLSEAERRVWRIFVGPDPDMKSNLQYAEFRRLLLEKPTKANA